MGKKYVVDGAKLKCSLGTKPGSLIVLPSRKEKLTGKCMGNIMDCTPANIPPGSFAACTVCSPPKPCTPACAVWIAGKTDHLIEKFPALLDSDKVVCMAGGGMIEITDCGQGGAKKGEDKVVVKKLDLEKPEKPPEGVPTPPKELTKPAPKSSPLPPPPSKDVETDTENDLAKAIVLKRIEAIKGKMTDGENKKTTYGVAVVKLEDGTIETWVAAAGKEGYVRPAIKEKDVVIKNKVPDGTAENRYNDAEQTLIREANSRNVEILAMGATRDVCPACQEVIASNNLIDRVVTPFKVKKPK